MKKLWHYLKIVDDNLFHWTFLAFIVAISLVPKFPIQRVEYTYIKIRIDDVLPVVVGLVFAIQWMRRKIKLQTRYMLHVLLFWVAVFASFAWGYYELHTIRQPVFNVGLLHSLRRIQYMFIFFVAMSAVVSEARFRTYMKTYLITLGLVVLYGLGQKFPFVWNNSQFCLPSIQSMNPAYVDGRLLCLSISDRINSTFGGHFDLAGYLTFSIPIIIGYYFSRAKRSYVFLFIGALLALLYTSARSSFMAYAGSITLMIFYARRWKFYLFVIAVTVALLFTTKDMTKRFAQTFQVKTVFVNEQSGQEQVSQKISVDNLPAGNAKINVNNSLTKKLTAKQTTQISQDEIEKAALNEAIEEAKRNGETLTTEQLQARADAISKYIKPQQLLLCDISCSTRLQVEWPRAIAAFQTSPLLGTGPYSLTEATDNDILRWLGEFGLFGTLVFVALLYRISRSTWTFAHRVKEDKYVYLGFVFGIIALLANALYVDVFEASKIAYNFWTVAGLMIGMQIAHPLKTHDKRTKKD